MLGRTLICARGNNARVKAHCITEATMDVRIAFYWRGDCSGDDGDDSTTSDGR